MANYLRNMLVEIIIILGTRGHNRKLSKESYRLNIREYSFSQRIVNTWNALPPYIINAKDTDTFKRLFDTHMSCHMLVYDE